MTKRQKGCRGCQLSRRIGKRSAGDIVIALPRGWTLNHYGGPEGYLGWMALQTRVHRVALTQLSEGELHGLGPCIRRVQLLLTQYWRENFPDDRVTRVYVTYFFESVFNKPKRSPYHLHLHLIPRLKSLDPLLREYRDRQVGPKAMSSINAWKVPGITALGAFPSRYRKADKSYRKLMAWMEKKLATDSATVS